MDASDEGTPDTIGMSAGRPTPRPRRTRYTVALLARGPREAGRVLPRLVRMGPLAGRFDVAIVLGEAARGLVVTEGLDDLGAVRAVDAGREGVLRAALADSARLGYQGTIAIDVGRGHDPAAVPQLALRLDQGDDVVRVAYPAPPRKIWDLDILNFRLLIPGRVGPAATAPGFAAFSRRVAADPAWDVGTEDPDDLDLWAAAIRRGDRTTEVRLPEPFATGGAAETPEPSVGPAYLATCPLSYRSRVLVRDIVPRR